MDRPSHMVYSTQVVESSTNESPNISPSSAADVPFATSIGRGAGGTSFNVLWCCS